MRYSFSYTMLEHVLLALTLFLMPKKADYAESHAGIMGLTDPKRFPLVIFLFVQEKVPTSTSEMVFWEDSHPHY